MVCLKDMTMGDFDKLRLPSRMLYIVFNGKIIPMTKFNWIRCYRKYKIAGYALKFKPLIKDTFTTRPEAEAELKKKEDK